MNDGLIYETGESGLTVLRELYRNNRTQTSFTCSLLLRTRGLDANEPGTLALLVDRIYDKKEDYRHPNGDRVYKTIARFTPGGKPFEVNITVHSRNADTTGATITLSDEALYAFREEKEE